LYKIFNPAHDFKKLTAFQGHTMTENKHFS